jgi:hypothetical protein
VHDGLIRETHRGDTVNPKEETTIWLAMNAGKRGEITAFIDYENLYVILILEEEENHSAEESGKRFKFSSEKHLRDVLGGIDAALVGRGMPPMDRVSQGMVSTDMIDLP